MKKRYVVMYQNTPITKPKNLIETIKQYYHISAYFQNLHIGRVRKVEDDVRNDNAKENH